MKKTGCRLISTRGFVFAARIAEDSRIEGLMSTLRLSGLGHCEAIAVQNVIFGSDGSPVIP